MCVFFLDYFFCFWSCGEVIFIDSIVLVYYVGIGFGLLFEDGLMVLFGGGGGIGIGIWNLFILELLMRWEWEWDGNVVVEIDVLSVVGI